SDLPYMFAADMYSVEEWGGGVDSFAYGHWSRGQLAAAAAGTTAERPCHGRLLLIPENVDVLTSENTLDLHFNKYGWVQIRLVGRIRAWYLANGPASRFLGLRIACRAYCERPRDNYQGNDTC